MLKLFNGKENDPKEKPKEKKDLYDPYTLFLILILLILSDPETYSLGLLKSFKNKSKVSS
ncbi:hypothetical protein [Orenia marismortui]|uniref:Uncharacterized protein n=1 Tax=Orenia marismortui TaxID=46469 RepID=A0A4R8GXM9_9FIRM|nr:hypothetical protein [Orenia marismortui]TDX51043.1 hypothetical protein C7959_11618 [Orenia marismortui]